MQKVVIFDIDGTLALRKDRSPYDWAKVGNDDPNKSICRILSMFNCCCSSIEVIIFSGRDEICRQETSDWLTNHGLHFKELHMRPRGDTRKDSIVKRELFEKHIKDKYEVIAIFDDRNQVVDMWRNELGLTCLQVAEGNF